MKFEKSRCMMATAAVIGLSTGKRLLSSSFCPSDLADKLYTVLDYGSTQFSAASTRTHIVSKMSSHCGTNVPRTQSIKALAEHIDTYAPLTTDTWPPKSDILEDGNPKLESSLELFISLQKSMLEKQLELSFNRMRVVGDPRDSCKNSEVICSGTSARQRRTNFRRKNLSQNACAVPLDEAKQIHSTICPELLKTHSKSYVRGTVSEDLLTHADVVNLSKRIQVGLSLEKHRSKLKEKLGVEPSDKQLASSLRMSRADLHVKLIECSLAREKLAMSNIRLVMSIAQKYDNFGTELADLIQGGLIGLLRGIDKFDSSKGFKISTYVYWWIRQGVTRALVGKSRTIRLPSHLHERLSSIRSAKIRLEEKGIAPSMDKIAERLNISQQKIRNATEADHKVLSLDREVYTSLNGLPGETFHSYIADNNLENNPWHGFEEWSLKDEVNKLLCATLGGRERDILRLYYGLDKECLTWEDISKRYCLSRERVRQVGIVALEKLKHAARKRRLDAMLVKH